MAHANNLKVSDINVAISYASETIILLRSMRLKHISRAPTISVGPDDRPRTTNRRRGCGYQLFI